MNYKAIAMLFLLPTVIYGGNEKRVKDLQEAEYKKHCEIALLSKKLETERDAFFTYRDIAFHYWAPENTSGVKEKMKSLDGFLDEIAQALNNAEDIKPLMLSAPLDKKDDDVKLDLVILRATLQGMFVDKITEQFEVLVQELLSIKKELKNIQK